MTSDTLYHLLLLSSIPGIGHSKLRTLVQKFGTPEEVFAAKLHQLTATDGFDQKTAEKILNPALRDNKFVEEQLKLIEHYKVQVLSFWDNDYPVNLKNIHEPPAFLFTRGDLAEIDRYAIAIVGTRQPTSYGKIMTETLARELAVRGITIVSGLARGIDTIAHHSALQHGGRTIAVLGSGVDRIYPAENFKLAMDLMQHGALISDYPMKTAPDAVNFPGRNRIISGLSLGTLIIEAGEKSGALITTEYAMEQNREVFAVPGNITTLQARGPNQLIKQGAKLVETVDDILTELESKLVALKQPSQKLILNLSQTEETIIGHILNEPIHVDAIAKQSNISVAEALTHLLNLELMGVVRQTAGKHFIRMHS
ncbi:DNA-processing protein DprA [bacterium]|nr:DNA-processing protein DprA [bacterium]